MTGSIGIVSSPGGAPVEEARITSTSASRAQQDQPEPASGQAAPRSAADAAAVPRVLSSTQRATWIATVVAVLLVVDQVTKWWARRELVDRDIDLLWTLRLNLAFNKGTAFSIFEGWGQVIGVAAIVIIFVLLRASRSIANRPGAIAMGMVLGGALGNLVDRIVQPGPGLFGGPVTDFFDLQWWPIFNVADIGITVGGVLLVLVGMRAPAEDDADAETAAPPSGSSDSDPAHP